MRDTLRSGKVSRTLNVIDEADRGPGERRGDEYAGCARCCLHRPDDRPAWPAGSDSV
jgi:hypothetical protein